VAAVIVNPNVRAYPVHSQLLGIQPDGGAGDPVQWNLHQVGADPVWDMGYRGQGVVVAGQDTGFDWQHPALRHSYRGWDETTGQADHAYNWHDVWDGSLEPFDEDGHGTHTLGIIVGDDEAGNRVGVAPAGRWIGCRNMRRGIGNPAAYLECMQFFLAPYPTGGDPVRDGDVSRSPDVVNNSWGCPDSEGCQADTLQGAVEALRAAGIMVVASAGNDGPACETVLDPIARYASAFTVGATNRGETIAYFSSRGPVAGANGTQLVKPDVVAPGDDVRSSTSGGGYGTASGTSMAGPHVAGVVALLWSARPELIGDVEATEDILRRSATPVEVKPACERPGGRPAKRGLIVEIANAIAYAGVAPTCACGGVAGVPNNVYGWGLVNAQEAAQMAIGSGEENK
jgi:subtilisin family serine protease